MTSPMQPDFPNAGFVADEMAAWLHTTSERGKQFTSLSVDLSTHVMRHIYSVQIRKSDCHGRRDPRPTILATLFMRGFSLFQSTTILLRRGLVADGAVTCRALLDLVFKFIAIRTDADALPHYVAEDAQHRLTLAKNLAKHPELYERTSSENELGRLVEHLRGRVKDGGAAKPLYLSEWASMAGLQSTYRVVYSILSSYVHSGVHSLEGMLVLDEDGEVEALKFEPEVDGMVFAVAIDYALMLCDAFASEFSLDWSSELSGFRERLAGLTVTA